MHSKVSTIPSQVNAELTHALQWLEKMGERGVYGLNAARLKMTAIRQLAEVLAPDEPQHAQWFLDNVDSIGARYANKNAANPSTVKTYVSRARGALAAYFDYLSDPASFQPKSRGAASSPSTDPKPRKKAKKKKNEEATEVKQAEPPRKNLHVSPEGMRDFPLDREAGRRILYQLPEDGLSADDAARFACHLLTLCDDFTPQMAQVIVVLRKLGQAQGTSDSTELAEH